MTTNKTEKNNSWRTLGLILIGLLFGYIIGRFELTTVTFKTTSQSIKQNSSIETAQTTDTQPTENSDTGTGNNDNTYSLGDEDAPIVVIDFSDYQCPFSKKFHSNILPQLKLDYIDTGKVKYIFKDFPLKIHPKVLYAHYAANCAGEQEKYWEMHDKLFENQQEWSKADNLPDIFAKYAQELKLNTVNFKDCLSSETYKEIVKKNKDDGIAYGAKGTPTLIVNGKIIRGVNTYDHFKQILEKAL